MTFRLASLDGERSFAVPSQGLVIGRMKDCDVVLPQALMLSRRHCRVRLDGETVLVEDLKSRNGCYVNDQRIDQSATLRAGDVLRIGGLRFRLEREGEGESSPASEPAGNTDETVEQPVPRKAPPPASQPRPSAGAGVPQWFVEEIMDELQTGGDPDLEETDDFTLP